AGRAAARGTILLVRLALTPSHLRSSLLSLGRICPRRDDGFIELGGSHSSTGDDGYHFLVLVRRDRRSQDFQQRLAHLHPLRRFHRLLLAPARGAALGVF